MSDKKFTLFEVHLDGDTQFGPSVIPELLGSEPAHSSEDERTDEDEAAADESDGGSRAIGVVVGLVALVVIALAVKRFRGGDDVDEALEEPEVVVN